MSENYICYSCEGDIDPHIVEKAKKTGKYRGLCQWCRDLQRNMNKDGAE